MELTEFINKAIGVPFKDHGRDFDGWDCWGMAVCFYSSVYGISIESFDGLTGLDSTESEKLFEDYRKSWVEVKRGEEKPGDLIIMRGRVIHVGIVVKKGMMLHTEDKLDTCVESYAVRMWDKRILTMGHYAKLANG